MKTNKEQIYFSVIHLWLGVSLFSFSLSVTVTQLLERSVLRRCNSYRLSLIQTFNTTQKKPLMLNWFMTGTIPKVFRADRSPLIVLDRNSHQTLPLFTIPEISNGLPT